MTDYVYSKVAVYAELGGALRLARNARSFATDPVTAAPINLTQGAFTAPYLDTDSSGIADFTSTTPGPIRLTTGATFVDVFSDELPGLGLAAVTSSAASAVSASASAADAALSASLVGAPADTAVAAIVGNPASATRVSLSSTYVAAFVATGTGIDPTGMADSTAAIQAKLDAAEAAGGGIVTLPVNNGAYSVTGLLMASGVTLKGAGVASQTSGPILIYAGAASGSVIGPKHPTTDTVNIGVSGLRINGGGLAAAGISMYRTSYSRLQDCAITGMQSAGTGVLFDANVVNQCYFNTADNMKMDGSGTGGAGMVGVQFQNGANVNRWSGGVCIAVATGMEFLTLSAGNIITGTDCESASVQHVYVDAPTNVFIGLHMESAPIGYNITANGNATRRFGTTFASSVTTFVQTLATGSNVLDSQDSSTEKLQLGGTAITSKSLSSSIAVNIDPAPPTSTSSMVLNWFRNITTSGTRQLNFYRADGTGNNPFILDLAAGNLTIPGALTGLSGYGSISFTGTAPTSGTYAVGSVCLNRLPAAGAPMGWVCTVAGTPGTWVPMASAVAKTGTVTLIAGTRTIADTAITANSVIRLTSQTLGGTPGALFVSAKTPGTNWVASSTSATDTGVIRWDVLAY